MSEKKTVQQILSDEAAVQAQASKAWDLAIINEGLSPITDEEEELERDTALETVAARLWLAAAQGDMKAIQILKDTLAPPKANDAASVAAAIGAASGAAAAVLVTRLEASLLRLAPGVSIVDANAVAVPVGTNHDKL